MSDYTYHTMGPTGIPRVEDLEDALEGALNHHPILASVVTMLVMKGLASGEIEDWEITKHLIDYGEIKKA